MVKKTEDQESVMEWVSERFILSRERLREIVNEDVTLTACGDFFVKTAGFMLYVEEIYDLIRDGSYAGLPLEKLESINKNLYREDRKSVV